MEYKTTSYNIIITEAPPQSLYSPSQVDMADALAQGEVLYAEEALAGATTYLDDDQGAAITPVAAGAEVSGAMAGEWARLSSADQNRFLSTAAMNVLAGHGGANVFARSRAPSKPSGTLHIKQ